MTYGQYCGFNEPLADKKAEAVREKQYKYSDAVIIGAPPVVPNKAIREKQYNYSGAVVIGNVVPDTEAVRQKQYNYSKAFVSHGETIEDVSEYIKKSAGIKGFFKTQHNFGRHPFATNV
jgi:hypothetical protein